MKSLNVFRMIALSALLTISASVASAANGLPTTCYVQFDRPCRVVGPNVYFAPNRMFADLDTMAHTDAARCMQRAAEYANWCGTEGMNVAVTFIVDGLPRPVLNAYSNGAVTYLYNSLWIYSGFAK